MKNHINRISKSVVVIILLVFAYSLTFAQSNLSKAYEWKGDVNSNVEVKFENFDTDLEVKTSLTNKVMFKYFVIAEAAKEEDIDKLNNYLESLNFKISKESAEFSTTIWKNKTTDMRIGKQHIKLTLKNGEKITLTKLRAKAELYLPSQAFLNLNTKYSDINMEDLHKLELMSFDDDISGKNIAENATINAKYTDMVFANLKVTTLDLFDSKFTAQKLSSLSITTKYSDIIFNDCGNLSISSFDDEISFQTANNLSLDAKYSDLECNSIQNLTTSLFDTDLNIIELNNIVVKESKYSELVFNSSSSVVIKTSFDDDYKIGSITSITADEMKYTDLSINMIKSAFKLTGFENNINIKEVSSEFRKLEIDQKYGKINVHFPDDLSLALDIDSKYGNLNYNFPNIEISQRDFANETRRLVAVRGTSSKKANISIKTHDTGITLN